MSQRKTFKKVHYFFRKLTAFSVFVGSGYLFKRPGAKDLSGSKGGSRCPLAEGRFFVPTNVKRNNLTQEPHIYVSGINAFVQFTSEYVLHSVFPYLSMLTFPFSVHFYFLRFVFTSYENMQISL